MNKQEKELLLKEYEKAAKYYWTYDEKGDLEMKAYELGKKVIIEALLPKEELEKINEEAIRNAI